MATSPPVIGLMSGTSLDGLDIVCVQFIADGKEISHRVLAAETVGYDTPLQEQLRQAHLLSGIALAQLDVALGKMFGALTADFCKRHAVQPAYIGSHGHTVFHQPEQGLTLQIGHPFHLAVASATPVVAQFRNMDVALGGQGAPLVPIADRLLYSSYAACLNLGGIANISIPQDNAIAAFDICVCNMALNALAQIKGKDYDEGGHWAAAGALDNALMDDLFAHPYHSQKGPRSLGKEYYTHYVEPLLNKALERCRVEDVLCTVAQYIGRCIGRVLDTRSAGACLVTGGGALNAYLIQCIRDYTQWQIALGTPEDIHYKEAIAFALLAYLQQEGQINVLRSVTGARCDHSAGILYRPPLAGFEP